jgi:division/cell wall cluster transcriptional repressor MraZ
MAMELNPSRYRPLFLTGEFDLILDEKNRILVPAECRKEILEAREENTLVCRIGRNRVLWLQPENYYREWLAQRRTSLVPGEDEEKFNEAHYGMIYRLTWDAQGRIVVPEKMIKRTNMGKNLTLVAAGDHMAVWNREDWEQRALAHLDAWNEISDRERQNKPGL